MKKFKKYIGLIACMTALFSCLWYVKVAYAQEESTTPSYYPEGFSDFFVQTRRPIHIAIAGERTGLSVSAMTNFERFWLRQDDEATLQAVRGYLSAQSVGAATIATIEQDMLAGIRSDEACYYVLVASECLLQATEMPRYAYDFDRSKLIIFMPANALDNQSDAFGYASPYSEHNALINTSRLYGSVDLDGGKGVSWSNDTVLGLPLGHVQLDTQYQQRQGSDSNFDVYKALYDLPLQGHRVVVGRSRYGVSFNTTDFLNNSALVTGDRVSVGSSRLLMNGREQDRQRIYFYAPSYGQLEVYQGERLLLSRAVTEGRQSIRYSELPKGAYDIVVRLNVAGNVLLNEVHTVVNNDRFSLPVGDWDYVVSAGWFDTRYSNSDDYYARALGSYRWRENWMWLAGLTGDGREAYGQVGLNWMWDSGTMVDYTYGRFDQGASFSTARLTWVPLFVDYRQLSLDDMAVDNLNNDDVTTLAQSLYGQQGYRDIGVGASWSWLGMNGYLRYSQYAYQEAVDEMTTLNHQYSLGLTRAMPLGSVNVTMTYTQPKSSISKLDQMWVGVTWSLPLGEDWSAQAAMFSDFDGMVRNTNSLRKQNRFENGWLVDGGIGATIETHEQLSAELSGTASGRVGTVAQMNAYGYVDDQQISTVSGTVSSTQVWSGQGLRFTDRKSDSYVQVQPQYGGEHHDPIRVMVQRDGRYGQRADIGSEGALLGQQAYQSLMLTVDARRHQVAPQTRQFEFYSYPGSVYQFLPELYQVDIQMVILDDVFSHAIQDVQCIGEGCVSVEAVTDDGVFRVSTLSGKPYRLVSNKGLCVLDESSATSLVIKGYCLPGIDRDASLNGERWQDSSFLLEKSDALVVYLGLFTSQTLEVATLQLETLNIRYKSIQVGGHFYLYVLTDQHFTSAQLDYLQELDAYVLLQGSELSPLTILTLEERMNDAS